MNKIKLWLAQSSIVGASLGIGARLFFSGVAFAQATTPGNGGVTDPGDLNGLLCQIARDFFEIIIIVSVLMVLYAAFEYVTGGDDTEKTTKARKILTYAAIGIAVAIIGFSLPSIVGDVFPQQVTVAAC